MFHETFTFCNEIYLGLVSCSFTYRTYMVGAGIGSGGFSNSSKYEHAMASVLPSLLNASEAIDES